MDYNSTKNQEIKRKLVQRDVHANVNSMVDFILSQSYEHEPPFTWDDIENFYMYPEYSGKHASVYTGKEEDIQEAINSLKEKLDETEDEDVCAEIEEEIQDLEELETEPQEIYEWWIVDSMMMEHLARLGEPVIRHENLWGRTTTGQAILLDYCISKMAEEMEILEGQECEWK